MLGGFDQVSQGMIEHRGEGDSSMTVRRTFRPTSSAARLVISSQVPSKVLCSMTYAPPSLAAKPSFKVHQGNTFAMVL